MKQRTVGDLDLEIKQLLKMNNILAEALVEIVAKADSGEWTLPSTFRNFANDALKKATYGT